LLTMILLPIVFAIIRSVSMGAAVQGRYLFPILPSLGVMLSMTLLGFAHKQNLYKVYLLLISILLVIGEMTATLGGWVYYQHLHDRIPDPTKAATRIIYWGSAATPVMLFMDIGSAAARLFMDAGWYPEEGAQQVWLRNRASIELPFLPESDLFVTIRAIPYLPSDMQTRELNIFFNETLVSQTSLVPGWNTVEFEIPHTQVQASMNTMMFQSPTCDSPYLKGESADPRMLSVGIDWIKVVNRNDFPLEQSEISRVTISDAGNLDIAPGVEIGCKCTQNKRLRLMTKEGDMIQLSAQSPFYKPQKETVINTIEDDSKLSELIQEQWKLYQASAADFPGIFGHKYVQESVLILYVVAVFTLSIVFFL
jgi:hypothetical protein